MLRDSVNLWTGPLRKVQMVTDVVLGAALHPVAFISCFVALAHSIFYFGLICRIDFLPVGTFDVADFDRVVLHATASDIEVGVVLQHLQVVTRFTTPQAGLVPVVLVV